MTLKDKVLRILEGKKHTYAELAKYLNLTEDELDHAFETNSIEIRTLEAISKELRIPLYSFFRDQQYGFDHNLEPYYNVNIWGDTDEENRKLIAGLQLEIAKLKLQLAEKDVTIRRLESELLSKK
jgi:transcriptional regulator with XRE-family HTH domain